MRLCASALVAIDIEQLCRDLTIIKKEKEEILMCF